MSRTIAEIYDALNEEKGNFTYLQTLVTENDQAIDNSQSLLASLTSTSKVAVWRLLLWVTAFGVWSLEQLFDRHKAEVEAMLDVMPHTPQWYRQLALDFQLGSELVWQNMRYQYDIDDPSRQIISQCAVVEGGGRITFKIVKGTDTLTPLTSAELTAFTTYMNKLKDAGVLISVRSWTADDMKLTYIIKYDATIMNDDGELLTDTSIKPVEDAISAYISSLDFNGRFSIAKLEDAIQAVVGVVDFERVGVWAKKYDAVDYTSIAAEYYAEAGYLALDTVNSNISYAVTL